MFPIMRVLGAGSEEPLTDSMGIFIRAVSCELQCGKQYVRLLQIITVGSLDGRYQRKHQSAAGRRNVTVYS